MLVPLIIIVVLGLLLLYKGKSVSTGLIGAMVLLIGIATLSFIQFSWLRLLTGEGYLFSKDIAPSLPEFIPYKFRMQQLKT